MEGVSEPGPSSQLPCWCVSSRSRSRHGCCPSRTDRVGVPGSDHRCSWGRCRIHPRSRSPRSRLGGRRLGTRDRSALLGGEVTALVDAATAATTAVVLVVGVAEVNEPTAATSTTRPARAAAMMNHGCRYQGRRPRGGGGGGGGGGGPHDRV